MKQKIFNFYQGHKKSIFISLFMFALLVVVGFQFDNLFLKKVNFKGDNVSYLRDFGTGNYEGGHCKLRRNTSPILSCAKKTVNSVCGNRLGINVNFLSIDGHVDIRSACDRAREAHQKVTATLQSLITELKIHTQNKSQITKDCSLETWEITNTQIQTEIKEYQAMLQEINTYMAKRCIPEQCTKIRKEIAEYQAKLKQAVAKNNTRDINNYKHIIAQLQENLRKLNCK